MNHDELKNLIPAFSIDALDENERPKVEQHLEAGCSECEALLAEMRSVSRALAFAAPAADPPPVLKERIFSQIGEEPVAVAPVEHKKSGRFEAQLERLKRSRQNWVNVSWSLGLALIVVALAMAGYTLHLRQDITTQKQQVLLGKIVIDELRRELASQERILRVVQSPRVRMVELKGQPPAQNADGTVVWDPAQREAVVYVRNLPPVSADRDYQLWMLRGSQPVDAGLLQVDRQGTSEAISIETISDTANLSAFAVTLEPKGGVPQQPTGAIYLVGAVTSP